MRNENIKERMKIEKITDGCMKTEVVWACRETRTGIRGKMNAGDGTAREKKRKTKAEMDRLCEI